MRERNNLNRQDTILGGMILGGFVVIAVIAALFTLVSWRGERTADVPKTTVGSSAHAWTPAAPAAPSAGNKKYFRRKRLLTVVACRSPSTLVQR
jgi:hypothetical protein